MYFNVFILMYFDIFILMYFHVFILMSKSKSESKSFYSSQNTQEIKKLAIFTISLYGRS